MAEERYQSPARFIPRKSRVRTEFVRGINGRDLIWLTVGFAALLITGMSFGMTVEGILLIFGELVVFGVGFIKIDDQRIYGKSVHAFKYLAYKKNMQKLRVVAMLTLLI